MQKFLPIFSIRLVGAKFFKFKPKTVSNDSLGKKLRAIWKEWHPPGMFSEIFKISDVGIGSGVYLIRVNLEILQLS